VIAVAIAIGVGAAVIRAATEPPKLAPSARCSGLRDASYDRQKRG
jgi:hypothetical protein